MNILVWLVVGGAIGWIASIFMGTDDRQGLFLNVVVGIVGAALGGWLFGGSGGVATINQGSLTVNSVMVSLVGAIVLVAAIKLLRRSSLF
jgi:uncharacterized membrane protein YeaQ/YmgE (transglycosylase-associated protein family)